MKKMKLLVSFFAVALLIIMPSLAGAQAKTYTKVMAGASFGDEDVCLMGPAFCFNDSSDPKLDTGMGHYFYVVPVAVRMPVQGGIGVRAESEFSVSKREFDLTFPVKHQEQNREIQVQGDDTRYSFGGNLLMDYETDHFTPYAGIGVGVEYSKLNANIANYQMDSHDDFARYWKYIAGVEVPIIGNLKGVAEYNYRQSDRYRDNDSQANWNLNGEHVINAGLSLYW